MKDHTTIVMILDASGSMRPLTQDVIGSVGQFIEEQKKVGDNFDVTMYAFNTKLFKIEDISQYLAMGSTALIDAVCKVIDETGKRLSDMNEFDRPDKVVMMIMTDGEENSSVEHTQEELKARVELQQNTYSWKFVFTGANIDSFATGNSYGVSQNTTKNFESTPRGVKNLYASLGDSVKSYRKSGDLSI